jgi:hypothetical protein
LSRSHSPVLGDGGSIEVFCGVEVARETHHAVALDRAGRWLVGRPLPNDETALRNLFMELVERGRLLVVVDQPASIGALAIAVARSMGVQIGYLPGLAMRRIADLYPGEGKTDARRLRDMLTRTTAYQDDPGGGSVGERAERGYGGQRRRGRRATGTRDALPVGSQRSSCADDN